MEYLIEYVMNFCNKCVFLDVSTRHVSNILFCFVQKDGEVKFGSVVFRPLDTVTIGLSLEEKRDKVVFRLLKPEVPGLSDTQ